MTLTVGSLFSGIGGLDLGLERAGMEVIWHSEIDPYGCRVLKKHWPEVPNHGNIKAIKWGDVVRPDVICGGYPCQPFSTAGKRNGTDDPRHLWPWVREAISELRPKYAILENVRGHVSLGLNIVLGEMASIGYDAEWQIVSAASVGAPHRRDRVIIVAYPNGRRFEECEPETEQTPGISVSSERLFTKDRWITAFMADPDDSGSRTPPSRTYGDWTEEIQGRDNDPQSWTSGCGPDVADTKINGLQSGGDMATIQNAQSGHGIKRDNSGAESRGDWWKVEPHVGRVAHGIPSRVDRLRGLGNAVVPQVAELVGRMVVDFEATR